MVTIISFSEKAPNLFKLKKKLVTQALQGELLYVKTFKLYKRVWGINVLNLSKTRYFFRPLKYSRDTFYEIKTPIKKIDDILRSMDYIIQTLTPQSKEKVLYKFLKSI